MRILALLTVALGPAAGFAQPAGLAPSAGVQPDRMLLSDSSTLTLAIEGPAPLRVAIPEEPAKLLAPKSAAVWRIRPAGDARLQTLDDGRERWEQSFRLDPFTTGAPVPVVFAPVKVTAGTDLNAQEVTWPTVNVTVELERWKTESGKPLAAEDLEKGRDEARITGIEQLPSLPPPQPENVGWKVAATLAAVFASVVAVALVRRYRAKPPPLPPGEWAEQQLDRLEADLAEGRAGAAAVADRGAAILREYIERRHGLTATRWTTAELLAASSGADWPEGATAELHEILEACDRAKFAGDIPDSSEAARLVEQTRQWVSRTTTPPKPAE